jgi:hypothetical protein
MHRDSLHHLALCAALLLVPIFAEAAEPKTLKLLQTIDLKGEPGRLDPPRAEPISNYSRETRADLRRESRAG